jgi:hypothetical protein
MECEICKLFIVGRTHFLNCAVCRLFFHRKGCIPPMPETIFRLHKNSYWSCPPCSASNIILLPPLLQTLTTLDVTSTPPQESLDTPSLEHSTNLEDYELLKSANGLKRKYIFDPIIWIFSTY